MTVTMIGISPNVFSVAYFSFGNFRLVLMQNYEILKVKILKLLDTEGIVVNHSLDSG